MYIKNVYNLLFILIFDSIDLETKENSFISEVHKKYGI